MIAAHWSAIMTVPHYINEGKSDMRGIKPGWYAIEDDGNLSSGPFSSHEECFKRINQPTNETGASKLQRGPN
jgi:hypothetical protein